MELARLVNGNLKTAKGRGIASVGNQIFISRKRMCVVGGLEEEFSSVVVINIFLEFLVLWACKALRGLFAAGRI